MGISRATIKLLMREGHREKFFGSVLTAGRQDVYATSKDLQKYAKEMKFQLKPGVEMSISDEKIFQKKGYITDRALLLSLGFDNIDSMDCSDCEQCTIVHDLNEDVSDKMHNKYDMILDFGTSEHIFNFPKVLENYNKMLKVGGRIIHGLPSSNYVDHGLYMFSPTLFYDYYSANKWDIIDQFFIKLSLKHNTQLWNIYNYVPDSLNGFYIGWLNIGLYAIWFIAKKTDKSTFNASVQQGYYLRRWNITPDMKLRLVNKPWLNRIIDLLPEGLKDILRPLYYQIIAKMPLRFFLKLIARY